MLGTSALSMEELDVTTAYDKIYVNDPWVACTSTETIDVIDSVNEEVMATIPAGTASASFASSPSERITSPSPASTSVDRTPILDIKPFVPRFDTPIGRVAAG